MAAVFLDGLDGGFDVPRIVKRVEHPEDVDAVFARQRHETVDNVVGIIPVADEVLAPQKHLQRGLFGLRL